MHFSTIAVSLTAASLASAVEHRVQLGMNGENVFSPDSVQAASGDTIRFVWGTGTHFVASGDFNMPCQHNGRWAAPPQRSGAGAVDWILQINDTQPIWAYCPVGDHCQEGMAMVINPPMSGDTLQQYKMSATNSMSGPAMPAGGMFANMTGSGSSSSSMGGASSSMSMTMGGTPSSSARPSGTSMAGAASPSSSTMSGSNDGSLIGAGAGAIAAGVAGIAFML